MLGVQTWEIKVSKMGYPYVILFNRIFHEINHPAIWDPPFMEAPHILRSLEMVHSSYWLSKAGPGEYCPCSVQHSNNYLYYLPFANQAWQWKIPVYRWFPIRGSMLKGFSIATFDYQRVPMNSYWIVFYHILWCCMILYGTVWLNTGRWPSAALRDWNQPRWAHRFWPVYLHRKSFRTCTSIVCFSRRRPRYGRM